jgi:predicted nucleic acid-binding protein
VDSSAWIALFSARDRHHADADRMFRSVIHSSRLLLTSNLIIAEVHRLLMYRAGDTAAIAVLERIEASPRIKIAFAGHAHHQAAKIWLSKLSGLSVSYTDAVSFAIMQSVGCTDALGYDQHFRAAGFALLSQ